jgi:hypothetical protein
VRNAFLLLRWNWGGITLRHAELFGGNKEDGALSGGRFVLFSFLPYFPISALLIHFESSTLVTLQFVHTHTHAYNRRVCLVCFLVCACVTSCITKHTQVFFFQDASLKTSQNERLCWHCWDARLLTVLENRVQYKASQVLGRGGRVLVR